MSCFDKVVDRRGTCSAKWDGHEVLGVPCDALPLWVADMDFEIMPQVNEAIRRRTEHAVYGYPLPSAEYYASIQGWMERRFNWPIEKDWILTIPGVVPALSLAIQAFTRPGDAVMIQPPVYPPFANAVTGHGRKLVKNPLVLVDGEYKIDFRDFEEKIAGNGVRLFLLCSPHNPVGRVWSPAELKQMAEICRAYDVLVVSDEIHQDLVYPGVRHYPFTQPDPAWWERAIVCTAPSKSFNLAGLQTSNIIIADPDLRQKFAETARCWGISKVNAIGLAACQAAYTHGDTWMDAVMAYIAENKEYVRRFLAENLPRIQMARPQGLFLLWLDFRALGMTAEELEHFLLHKAGLWLNQGYTFGEEGAGFARLNIGCPRSTLETAMERLQAAVGALGL
ncbi:MAG TPA: MalY/PatB family protein [Bacillota bacterium]|nr:MalY/PatB family protein [Bacillota bacterium]HPZ90479.1 MalY/PatB family protein [Bacillota bacterium]HQE02331.1 MalY/PatB family protein [Bacillota bacterium]